MSARSRDPIEMIVPALNQMQVQPTIDLTFEQGIRTLLRQDPTSSWSAKSATWPLRRWRCRRR